VDLPPHINLNGKRTLDRDSAFALANELKKGKSSRLRRRKFIYGALYDELLPGYKIIDLSNGLCDHVEIVVTLEDGTTSVVRIGSAKDESAMLNAIVGLGKVMPTNGNARGKSGDVGDMFALGYRSLGKCIVYEPTKKEEISDAMAEASTEAGVYLKEHWTSDYDDIRDTDNLKSTAGSPPLKEMGGKDGPGNVIMLSRNIGNSSHVDNADGSRSVAVWAEEEPGRAKNWSFLLPDVSIDGSLGVVIKLFHGAVISWDGREVRHCSSIPKPGDGNNVYGCMFGSCR
jgi:hypothetical protein